MPLSLQWSSGVARCRWSSTRSLPSHSSKEKTPPPGWSWSSGRAGRHMLKPWRAGRRLTEDGGLGEPALESGPTSTRFSSPLEQTTQYGLGHTGFLCSGRCTLSLGFNSCPFFCELYSVVLTFLQRFFSSTCKINSLLCVFLLVFLSPWVVKAMYTHSL